MIIGKDLFQRKVYSFPRGGISFDDPSVPSRDSFETAFLPSLSVIPLVQHNGGRAYPVVSVGEAVKEGMLIGRGRGPGSVNVHATVPGKVIRMVSWKTAGAQIHDGMLIRMEGSFDKLGKREESYPWEGMLPYDIQRTISDYGVTEMEGAGKPVSDIISGFRAAPEPITLVVSCVFDDPWLAADFVLCRERPRAVTEGAAITALTCRVSRIIYVISYRERELEKDFASSVGKWGLPSNTVFTGSRYPQRNRRELELVLRNYGKKEGLELGSLFILGPATLAAVYDAVKLRKPILERYLTVGGSAVKRPQVMKVRIGTRVGEVFAECGGFTGAPKRIAAGSPLLGRPIINLDEPVIKNTYALFAVSEGFRKGAPAFGNSRPGSLCGCISCGECRSVCPVGLDPEELYKQTTAKGNSPPVPGRASECHGCGCCEVVCPSRLPLSTRIMASALRGNQ